MTMRLAFDVYGTLVDPMGMSDLLKQDAGEEAEAVAALWREKQLEFSFRKGLMKVYEDFGVCTRQALRFAMATHKLALSEQRENELLTAYLSLPAFDDSLPALQALKGQYPLFAFSNGSYPALEKVLGHNGLLEQFEGLVSVDDLKTFKPDPAVYTYARRATGAWDEPLCLVSSNAWDVIGARAAGLLAVWVKRDAAKVFEDWGIEPSAVISSLSELPETLKTL
ncbi:haloacid dehalogenase type II [Marinobacter sp. M216]|uniref:(S)-2-haloacid dehalogenase n=1 Tax=Marinobacter albus TaxID=3030833 RepID=A0ABT7H8A8_9GAMM|nr:MULTISPECIES: haloacid dehalogenase type II [unclassified Marinobacter]MBW7471591.1 haloacid dehalogenase type II [Marinobacter sp. F4218]MDK9556130.1 haloacid dehalogenase type II [Marinobacter sp. M216]